MATFRRPTATLSRVTGTTSRVTTALIRVTAVVRRRRVALFGVDSFRAPRPPLRPARRWGRPRWVGSASVHGGRPKAPPAAERHPPIPRQLRPLPRRERAGRRRGHRHPADARAFRAGEGPPLLRRDRERRPGSRDAGLRRDDERRRSGRRSSTSESFRRRPSAPPRRNPTRTASTRARRRRSGWRPGFRKGRG